MWLLFTLGYLSAVIELHLLTYNLSVTVCSLYYSICTIVYFLTSLFESKLVKLSSGRSIVYFGIILTSISFLLIGPWDFIFPNKVEIVGVGLGLLGLAGALMYSNYYIVPTTSEIINSSVNIYGYRHDEMLLDSVASLTNFFSNIGECFGPIFAGVLTEYFGYSHGFTIISWISFIFFIGYFILSRATSLNKESLSSAILLTSASNS